MSTATYLSNVHSGKGLRGKRCHYLRFLRDNHDLLGDSILEVGAGTPAFLKEVPFSRRVALDNDDHYRQQFEDLGVDFIEATLDAETPHSWGSFAVIVCSDVFEHLLHPEKALQNIRAALTDSGILISHVPNEYRFLKTVKVMLGKEKGMYYHKDQEEWNDPHLRRFTDIGFRKFLSLTFSHNLRLNSLMPSRVEKGLNLLGLPAPYCLQAGPTYLSTNDEKISAEVRKRYRAASRFM